MNSDIRLIAIDLDGTLLNGEGQVTVGNETAVKRAISQGVPVIIATGKTRYAAEGAIAQLGLQTPGVFIQGLVICNADGSIRYEQQLGGEIIAKVIAFCQTHDLDPVAYCHDRLLILRDVPYRYVMHEQYGEPFADILPAEEWAAAGVNKILPNKVGADFPTDLKLELRELMGETAVVTQAIPSAIEVLPPNSSKGAGVDSLLTDLRVDWQHVLAIGDGENDIEMLQAAGIGVAMGNANDLVKGAADYVVASHHEDGVAEAINRFVLR